MRVLLLILLLSLFGQFVLAQDKPLQKDEFLFEKGLLLQALIHDDLEEIIHSADSSRLEQAVAFEVKETILEKAIEYYEEIIEGYPKSTLRFRAMVNKGFIERKLNHKAEAKETFQQLLFSKADDKEKGGLGSGIMAEPYANYKNMAAKILAELYMEDSNYTEAIKYLEYTKQYPYQHFCGNEASADRIYVSELYAKCYLGLHNNRKAIEVLLPNVVEDGLANNSELVELAYHTMLKEYKKEELKAQFEEAFKNHQIEKVKSKYSDYEIHFIVFLNTKIELSDWFIEHYDPDDEGYGPGDKDSGIEKMYKKALIYSFLSD